jgi:hypothetical protein
MFWHSFLHKGFLELADSNIMDGGHNSSVLLNAIYMDKCKCSCSFATKGQMCYAKKCVSRLVINRPVWPNVMWHARIQEHFFLGWGSMYI